MSNKNTTDSGTAEKRFYQTTWFKVVGGFFVLLTVVKVFNAIVGAGS